jgi:hypothetical protein
MIPLNQSPIGENTMITQKRIYELAKLCKSDVNAVKEMDHLKESDQIAYDIEELWYRPVNDIGKPLDMVLYREFFGYS